MYSLNVPLPDAVVRLAAGLGAGCRTAEVRDRRTLVAKRLGQGPYPQLASRSRTALAGTDPFTARVAGLGLFERPPGGKAPVIYLAVESPALEAIHDRLCLEFDPVAGLEGESYVPHVTIARGGDAERLLDESIEPVSWSVDRLVFWDANYHEPIESVALPA